MTEHRIDPAWHEREAARLVEGYAPADLDRARIHAEIAKSLRMRDLAERFERIAHAIPKAGRGGF